MANKKNKVKFNICNVHYAPITVTENNVVSFGTPVAMPGAVSISLDPTGEPESFYADGIEYYVINNNQGYDGDLELAMIPESFRTDILKETADANNVLVENANSETGSFALLFEFDGDIRKIRHVMYNCSASRPTIESKTNEEDKEVQTETLTIKARPMADGYVKGDGCLSPRVCLECNPEIPVAAGEEHWLLDTSLDEVYWPCSHSRAIPSFPSQLEWKIGWSMERRLRRYLY